MVARVWRVSVRRTDADDYAEHICRARVADYAATPGNEGVWVLRRDVDDRTEFVLFTLWQSLDAVRALADDERDVDALHYEVSAQEGRWEPSAGQRARVDDFVAAYRAAFEAFDVQGIADLFAYPCQVTGSGARAELTAVASRDAWLPQLERLLTAYRAIGVRTAHVAALRTIVVAPDLLEAVVRWELAGTDGSPIYAFDAAYTLADLVEGQRITAIAHNETPQLRARLAFERLRPTSRTSPSHSPSSDL